MAEGVVYNVSDSWRFLDVAVKVQMVEVVDLVLEDFDLLCLFFYVHSRNLPYSFILPSPFSPHLV